MVFAPVYYFRDIMFECCLFPDFFFFFCNYFARCCVEKTDIFVIAYACLSGDLKEKISSSFESSLKKKFPYQQGKSVGI